MSAYQYPDTLPVITTGGWARPGWWDILADADADGRFGPADCKKLFDDYWQLVIYDQEAAGLDILPDGEHRRLGWTEGITGSMPGIKMRPAPRKLGAIGGDMLPVYEVQRPLDDIESIWDYASEYRFLRAHRPPPEDRAARPVRHDDRAGFQPGLPQPPRLRRSARPG